MIKITQLVRQSKRSGKKEMLEGFLQRHTLLNAVCRVYYLRLSVKSAVTMKSIGLWK